MPSFERLNRSLELHLTKDKAQVLRQHQERDRGRNEGAVLTILVIGILFVLGQFAQGSL